MLSGQLYYIFRLVFNKGTLAALQRTELFGDCDDDDGGGGDDDDDLCVCTEEG